MHPPAFPPTSLHRWPLALGVLGWVLVLVVLPPAWQAALALDRTGLAAGQGWRLWTGHAVHYGLAHAAVNAAALAALLAWLRPGRCLVLGAVVCLPLLGAAVLWLEPALLQYRGASGAVVWLGTLAWWQAWQARVAGRGWLLLLAAVVAAKLAWEGWPGRVAQAGSLPEGVSLAWSAHLAGAVLGLGWAAVCRFVSRTVPGR